MIIPTLEQNRKEEKSRYGEGVRLSNEFRPHKEIIQKNDFDEVINVIPEKKTGFNIEDCNLLDIKNFLASKQKKSKSQISFLNRVMAWRFENEFGKQSNEINKLNALEKELILSAKTKEVEFLGDSGLNGTVMLDGSIGKRKSSKKYPEWYKS